MILWVIGMSGSGKTTLTNALYSEFKPKCKNLVELDGDVLRDVFRNDADHTVEGRRKNAERISHLCKFLDNQGIHGFAAVLSIFPEWQKWNRETFSSYYEVFLDVPIDTLIARDTKGLYARALRGDELNVVGVDIPFPTPAKPDLTLTLEDQDAGVNACVKKIIDGMPSF